MKKIYMILAAITLLSLSLNAQTRATENVTDHIVASAFTATTSNYSDFSGVTFTSDAVYAGNSALDNSVNIQLRSRNSTSGIVTTTSGGKVKSIKITVASGTNTVSVYGKNTAYTSAANLYSSATRGTLLGSTSSTGTITVSGDYEYIGIRSSSGAVYLSSIDVVWEREVSGPTIQASPSSVSMSAAPGGTATETVTVTGLNLTDGINYTLTDANGVFSVNRPSMGSEGGTLTVTYSPTAVGTHTATLTLSSNGAQDVTIPLNGTCATEVTVSDGTDTDMYLPVYGSYYDQVQMNQMIYPANMLSNLQGKDITSITFYPASGQTSGGDPVSGIMFSGGKVMLSLGSTTNNSFTTNAAISATVTEVASITDVQQDANLTAWTFTFDTPYPYEGGNLLVQVDTEAGSYYRTFFYGSTQSNMGRHQCSSDGGNALHNFLPKVTFTYEDNDTPALIAPTNGQEINVGESLGGAAVSKTITVSGRNLTEALTVSVSGTGFSVSPATLNAADVNNGTATVTVTYQGTANGTGTLTITSGDTGVDPVTVNLTATYVDITPVLTDPVDESTVNVGTNTGSGVSKTINIKGNYLTQDLTVSVSGTGFSVSRDVTVTAAEANAGKDIIVTYNGTNTNATGTLTISSSEVSATVHLTASYSDNGEITVANGTDKDMYLPVYGSYYEQVQHNQMIYPASMLSDMEGKYITSITFYPASGQTSGGDPVSGIMFSGGKVMLSLGSTTNNSFTTNAAISATVTEVASITDVQQDANLTAWTFTFDTPYPYEGGNLLVQVDTEAGSYYRTYFYGTEMSNMGRHQYGSTGGLDNFLPKATFTYSSTAPLPPAVEGGLLRLHLLFCDQLKANIPDDNKHPDAYGYVLKFEPEGGETQESGKVKVDIQKTDCEVMGYYTLDQIDRDTNRGLTMDVLTADVEFDLTATNDMLNYYYLQGKENGYPELDKDYLSQLHRQEDFTYREMYTESFEFDQVFNSGKHHYFNSAAEPIIGTYGDATKFVSYAPSVTTWGVQRRYFELDGKDNTYGAPVWKTAVGKVEMSTQVKPVVERQTNNDNSVNWGSGEEAASLYMLDNVEAIGYLPPTNLTKVEFEPYMFRIFVESKNGLLRPYKVVEADPTNTDQPGEHLEAADGELTEADMKGPICVWSGYIKYDNDGLPTQDPENGVELSYQNINGPFTFHKDKVDRDAGYTPNGNPLGEWDKDSNNAMFGALDALAITGYDAQGKPILNNNITENDLKIFVRFYYSVKGELADHTPWTRAEGSRSGNGAESGGKAPDPATGVNEIVYHGEIVETIYYNVQGMMSDKPFEGVNIIVNRYSDGAISVTKVITK